MKVIDLLNKIANNEEVPQYVKYRNWNNNSFEKMLVCEENIFYKLDQLEIYLNDEIEIIEEKPKKIEKLKIKNIYKCDDCQQIYINFKETWNKINEIIDYLLEKESK